MRLIDADKFKVQVAGMTALNGYPPSKANALCELIDRQPTVRDTEKAAEELKDLKLAYYLEIANTGDERLDAIYKNVGYTLDRAIEIIEGNRTIEIVKGYETDGQTRI